jgi:hypothetical protein
MLKRRKKRSLNWEIEHLRDTRILFIGIEGGSDSTSREHRYFDIFKKDNLKIQIRVYPSEENRSSPNHVLAHLKRQLEQENLYPDDEKWLVIDVDRYTDHLREVAKECKDAGIELAVSNPCFEYWLLLHYQEPLRDQVEECRDIKPVLSRYMEADPNKSEGYDKMFKQRAHDAVRRAKELDNSQDRWPQHNGSRVYRIIEKFL